MPVLLVYGTVTQSHYAAAAESVCAVGLLAASMQLCF